MFVSDNDLEWRSRAVGFYPEQEWSWSMEIFSSKKYEFKLFICKKNQRTIKKCSITFRIFLIKINSEYEEGASMEQILKCWIGAGVEK